MRTTQPGHKTRFIDFALEHFQNTRKLWYARPIDDGASEAEWQTWALQLYDEAVRCIIFSGLAIEAEAVVLFRLRGETALHDDPELQRQFKVLFFRKKGDTGRWCQWAREKKPLLERILHESGMEYRKAIDTAMHRRNEAVHFVAGDLHQLPDGEWQLDLLDLRPGESLHFAEKWFRKARSCFNTAAEAIQDLGRAHDALKRKTKGERADFFSKITLEETKKRPAESSESPESDEEESTDPTDNLRE